MTAAVAALRLTVSDMYMSYFSSCSVNTRDDVSVNDETSADTGSQCHHEQIAVTFSTALPHFAKGRNIGIISCRTSDVSAHKLSHFLCGPVSMPAKVHTYMNVTVRLYRTRNSDADAFDIIKLQLFLSHMSLYGICHIRKNILAFLLFSCWYFPIIDKNTIDSKNTAFYCGTSDIYTNNILIHSIPSSFNPFLEP